MRHAPTDQSGLVSKPSGEGGQSGDRGAHQGKTLLACSADPST
jgi:hypothetical protein